MTQATDLADATASSDPEVGLAAVASLVVLRTVSRSASDVDTDETVSDEGPEHGAEGRRRTPSPAAHASST